MQLEHYDFIQGPNNSYEFYSVGPKGFIKKVVYYFPIDAKNRIYNLAFGDWDASQGRIDDKSISDNNDKGRILATVAATVLLFAKHHPDAIILALGSTPSRNRLYQISISTYWNEISQLFEIEGYINGKWEPFRKGLNYAGFMINAR